MNNHASSALFVALITLFLVAACAAPAAPGPSASASQPPASVVTPSATAQETPAAPVVTLHLADAEDPGRSSQTWIDKFISAVSDNSAGGVRIEPIYNAGGDEEKPEEEVVAQRVMSGDVEMAIVPIRAWGDVGVTSLDALQAPLLIDNDALFTAVAKDPLVDPLLGAMYRPGTGRVGGLWPDDLRHVFTWETRRTTDRRGRPDLEGAKVAGR